MKKRLRGTLCLLVTTIIWGSAFIAQSVGMEHLGPFSFLACRSVLAVLCMIPAASFFDRKAPVRGIRAWAVPRLWTTGLLCGVALFIAAALQQIGIQYTDAGKAGFITAMYIVLVPLCGLFFRKKPTLSALLSVIIAVAGLYLLCGTGVRGINKGDLYIMGSALAFAMQITLVDALGRELDGLRLNCIQNFVAMLLAMPFLFFLEKPGLGDIGSAWLPLCYAGILSSGLAYSLQIIGQKDLEPTAAALIMSLESVFAVLFGWLLLHEVLRPVEALGCGLVFAAVIFAQLPLGRKKRKEESV